MATPRRAQSNGWAAVALIGLALVILLGGAVAYEGLHVGSIYPGVRAGDVDLGDLSQDAAAQKLQAVLDGVTARQVVAGYGSRSWTTSFADLGLRYDAPKTVAAAYAVGRQAGPVSRLWVQFLVPLTTPAIVPTYALDDGKLREFVQQLSLAIDRPEQDAGVRLAGTQLAVTAARDGLRLDTADTVAQLRRHVAQLSTAPIALKVTMTAPATSDGDVGDAIAQARQWVSTDLTLESPVGTARLSRDQIAGLIHLSQPAGKGSLQATLDTTTLRSLLAPMASAVIQAPRDAAFAIQDGKLTVVQPGRDGRAFDLDAAVSTVADAIRSGQGVVSLPVKVQHPDLFSLEDVAPVQQQINQIAGQPVTLTAKGKTWTLAPRDLSAFLQLATAEQGGRQRLSVALQTAGVTALAKQIADDVDQPAANAKFAWRDGTLTIVAPAQNGNALDQAAAVKAIVAAMQGSRRTVALPIGVIKPAITGDHPEALGIKQLVATGTSNFAGSPPERIQNIRRGAQLIDGAIIAPGEIFSFDDSVGDISTDNGFTTGLVILDHETKDGVGGGICQVSTTVFRAAFWAGLPIVERHDHAYAVPYYTQGGYPEGFDATIYSPQLDLKFKNDTPAALLLQTSMVEATSTLTVTIYGADTGRSVKLTPGPITNRVPHPADQRRLDATLAKGVVKQVDWSHDGFDTWISRTITVGGQVATNDVFKSHLEAWQAIYLIGTGGTPAKKAAG